MRSNDAWIDGLRQLCYEYALLVELQATRSTRCSRGAPQSKAAKPKVQYSTHGFSVQVFFESRGDLSVLKWSS